MHGICAKSVCGERDKKRRTGDRDREEEIKILQLAMPYLQEGEPFQGPKSGLCLIPLN